MRRLLSQPDSGQPHSLPPRGGNQPAIAKVDVPGVTETTRYWPFLFSASIFFSGFFSGFSASVPRRCSALLDFASSASMIFAAFAQGYSRDDSFCAKIWVENSAKNKTGSVFLIMMFFCEIVRSEFTTSRLAGIDDI